jgi:hypothetical protein
LENADFTTDVSIDKGDGHISVEALDEKGDYRNFLNLQTVVVSPKGERQTVRLEQAGPGRYEAHFPTKEVGSYLLNLMEFKEGKLAGSQAVGASVNYSPEFNAPEPNVNLLKRLAEAGGGKMLDPKDPSDNPFLHDRKKTFQPRDFWEALLQFALILFTVDVGVRRIQIDREEWRKAMAYLRRRLFFWSGQPRPAQADESLAALLARRGRVRAGQTAPGAQPDPNLFRPEKPVTLPTKEPSQGSASSVETPPTEKDEKTEEKPVTTTSRLLDAKRRARKKMD